MVLAAVSIVLMLGLSESTVNKTQLDRPMKQDSTCESDFSVTSDEAFSLCAKLG